MTFVNTAHGGVNGVVDVDGVGRVDRAGASPARHTRGPTDALLLEPWSRLDDDGLLGHFRRDRGVRCTPVVDADECRADRIEGVIEGRFTFVGETHVLGESIDWPSNPSRDVEWHILLHKFYYAVGLTQRWQRDGDARALARWQHLIDSWIAQTPPGFIAADVTGRRVQNWIYSLWGPVLYAPRDAAADVPRAAPIPAAFWRRMLHSIHEQVEFLCANLTPKRNHRTLELLAIFLAGVVFPEFRRAETWRSFALEQTLANVQADLLIDGVHCELSTDYHHLALRNWLQVRALAADNGVVIEPGLRHALDRALEAALEFGMHVHQPNGSMPSLSDGDVRGFLPLLAQGAQLFGRADVRFVATGGVDGTPPSQRVAHFAASGYHVIRSDWQSPNAQHLVFDCGPLGEGNHGHFDALSFELAAFGHALVVDPARFTYSEATTPDDPVNWRVHFRGTAAHNTVCVDGRNQTRYEPRVLAEASRHAHGSVRHKIAGPAPRTTLVESHDGKRVDLLHGRCASLAYDVVHGRCIVFVDRRYWIVTDWLRSSTAQPGHDDPDHDFALRFQLNTFAQGHSRLDVDDDGVRLSSPHLTMAQPHRAGHRAVLADGWVSPRYGCKDAAPAFDTHARGRDADFDTVLLPWAGVEPALRVRARDAVHVDGRRAHALCIDVAGAAGCDGWFHARDGGEGPWRIGALTLTGRWLHWRCDAEGRLVRAVSHAGAVLVGPDGAQTIEAP